MPVAPLHAAGLFLALPALIGLAGCSDPAPPPAAAPPPTLAAPPPASPLVSPPAIEAAKPRPDPDGELLGRVVRALEESPEVNAQGMGIIAKKGIVRLYGTVFTEKERASAGRIAGAVPGVSSVENKLVVVAGS